MNLALAEFQLPIRISRERPISDEELLRLSEASSPLRLERDANGELIVMSPTGTGGGRIETRVIVDLGNWAREDGRGEAFGSNTGVKLPDGSVRAADAAWVSLLRLNSLSEAELKGYAPICPEFVIEVRSESDKLADLQAKMELWITNGAEVGWLIDPIEKAVTIYRAGEEAEWLAGPTSVQGSGPVAGFELVMARVWE